MFRPSEVINAILDAARAEGRRLTPLQIVKLAYIGHGWWLQQTGHPLVKDDVQAWKYGPVFPSIYRLLKRYGRNPVTEPVASGVFERGQPLSDDARAFIGELVRLYGGFSGAALSNLTHTPGSPWTKVYKAGELNTVIPDPLIRDHYEALYFDRRAPKAATAAE